MNSYLRTIAETETMNGLEKVTEGSRKMFYKMYSPDDANKPLYDIIAELDDDDLDNAMDQVMRTIEKHGSI